MASFDTYPRPVKSSAWKAFSAIPYIALSSFLKESLMALTSYCFLILKLNGYNLRWYLLHCVGSCDSVIVYVSHGLRSTGNRPGDTRLPDALGHIVLVHEPLSLSRVRAEDVQGRRFGVL